MFVCVIYERWEGKEKGQTMTQATSSSHIYGPAVSHLLSPTKTDRKTIKNSQTADMLQVVSFSSVGSRFSGTSWEMPNSGTIS